MLAGVFIGRFWFPKNLKKLNENIQVVCTMLLIFSMGTMLGKRENLLDELVTLGFKSVIFCIVPTALSIYIVYFLTEKFLKKD